MDKPNAAYPIWAQLNPYSVDPKKDGSHFTPSGDCGIIIEITCLGSNPKSGGINFRLSPSGVLTKAYVSVKTQRLSKGAIPALAAPKNLAIFYCHRSFFGTFTPGE
jgi:hypothetical protein